MPLWSADPRAGTRGSSSRSARDPGNRLRPGRSRALVAILSLAAGLSVVPVSAQESLANSILINPGARSIGFGGAFAAIADDATAAFANPAGLVQILRPEISAEFRGTRRTSSAFGPSFELASTASGLGFFSFVYPARRWSIAVYSHQLASLELTIGGAIPYANELNVQSYSAAAAFRISERVSLGGGFSSYRGERSSTPFSPRVSDNDWGFNTGLLWTVADHWRLAGFCRQGAQFQTETVHLPLDPSESPSNSTLFEVPNIYGAGVAFRPAGGGLTFGVEIDRVSGTEGTQTLGTAGSGGGTELHFGAEYAVLKWKPVVAFRIGLWQEARGGRTTAFEPEAMVTVTDGDATHVAFGAGFAFRHFQLDLGADVSDNAAVGSLSMVISF